MASNEELVNEYQTADESRKMDLLGELYQQNRPIIYKIAKSAAASPEDLEDYLQDAFIILKSAADLFKPDCNASFITYLSAGLIRGFMKARNKNKELPDYMALRIYRYNQLKDRYIKRYGREPKPREVEAELEITSEQYKKMQQTIHKHATISLNDIVPGSEDLTVGDTIEDPAAAATFEEIEEDLAREQAKKIVWDEVNKLPDNQASAITEFYRNGKSQKAIAEEHGQSSQYISKCIERGQHDLQSNETLKSIALEVYGIRTKAESIAYHGSLYRFTYRGIRSVEEAAIYLIEHGL